MAATPQMALEAAAAVARQAGYDAHILGDALEGEARDVGKVLAGIALQAAEREQPFRPPCVLLSGGETTVTVRGQGSGGRNVECLLSLALALRDHPRIHALMADTDGVDGAETSPAPASAADAGARLGAGHQARAGPGRQRRPRFLQGAGCLDRDRRHAHQRQRFPRHPHRREARRPLARRRASPAPSSTQRT